MTHFFRTIRRSAGNLFAITRGRLAGRTCVPDPRRLLTIETSQRCNLACRFCAYAATGPGVFMDPDVFRRAVDEGVALGFSDICLTPMLGELFADPGWRDRFDTLQAHPGVSRFVFYTNFIMPRAADVAVLPDYGKLDAIYISIYGLDAEDFERVTCKPASQFEKLMGNLHALADAATEKTFPGGIHFNIRTVGKKSAGGAPDTELTDLLHAFRDDKGARITVDHEYDSWGGTVSQQDVDPIGVTLTDGNALYMRGACRLLFSSPQVMADGTVHACACRDVDGSLRLGHLADASLASVLSSDNPAFRAIIDAQQTGNFGPNCRSCSLYRSIFDDRASRNDSKDAVMGLDAALEKMRLTGNMTYTKER